MSATEKSVLLLGATGVVGGECLKLLANDPAFSRVVVITRSKLNQDLPKKIERHQIDFENPESYRNYLKVDAVICALGTTIAKAKTQEAFRRIDYDYPLNFAREARQAGAKHYLLVSSIGANAESRTFYTRVKGELERDLQDLGYPALSIFRPSLILGHRNEFRLGERIGKLIFAPLQFLIPRAYRPIQARSIAEAMVRRAKLEVSGVQIVSNQSML